MKFCLALLSLVAVAHGGTTTTVASITKSQEQCKDVYQFDVAKSTSHSATTVVITPNTAAALTARMIPSGSATWPSTLTQGTHFTVAPKTGTGCDGTVDATATAAYASVSGAITVTHTSSLTHVCVKLIMCTLVYSTVAGSDWVVTTSSDTTESAATTVTALTTALIGTKITSAPFAFTPTVPLAGTDNVMTVTPTFVTAGTAATNVVTISMKGFTQKSGSVCSIDGQAYDATTADSVNKIAITLMAGKLLVTEKVISCTKIQGTAAAAATVPNGFGIAYGASATAVVGYFYADAPIINAAPAPTAAFSSAPSTCANVLVPSLLALVAASLLV